MTTSEPPPEPPGPAAPLDPVGGRRSGRARLVRAVLLLLAAAFAVVAVASQWGDVSDDLQDLSAGHVGLAAAFTLGSLWASFLAWRATLAGLGDEVAVAPGARIFFVGQLGKYIPGSVFALVGQVELGRAQGLRRDRLAAAGVLVLAISLAVALVLALLAVPASVSAGGAGYALLVLLVVPLVVVLHPRVLSSLLDRALRLIRRPPLDQHLTGAAIWRIAGLSVLSNGLLGLEVWQLSVDLGGHGGALPVLCIGAYALAAGAGLVAIPLPAGAGLREAILVLLLAPQIGTASATLVALLARLVATVADVVVAGIVAFATRSPHRAGSTG